MSQKSSHQQFYNVPDDPEGEFSGADMIAQPADTKSLGVSKTGGMPKAAFGTFTGVDQAKSTGFSKKKGRPMSAHPSQLKVNKTPNPYRRKAVNLI